MRQHIFSVQSFRFPTSFGHAVILSQKEGIWSLILILSQKWRHKIVLNLALFYKWFSLLLVPLLANDIEWTSDVKSSQNKVSKRNSFRSVKLISALRHPLMATRVPITSTTAHTLVDMEHSAGTRTSRCWFTEHEAIMGKFAHLTRKP